MERIEVITSVQRRRRYTASEKAHFVALAAQSSISQVARQYAIAPSLLFKWRALMQNGGITAIGANEAVVSQAEYKALLKKVKQLEQMLGRKTMENEILKDAVELAHAKKYISHMPLLPPDDTPSDE